MNKMKRYRYSYVMFCFSHLRDFATGVLAEIDRMKECSVIYIKKIKLPYLLNRLLFS